MNTKLSIVVALLNESTGLERLRREIFAEAASIPDLDVELILVDDGSTDDSWQVIRRFSKEDARIRGVRLSRNFGNHAALLAGLRVARGEIAMNLAADLQTPVRLIRECLEAYRRGAEIVFAARRQRSDRGLDLMCARIYYLTVNLLTPQRMPSGGIDVFLVTRAVLKQLAQVSGRNTSILGLIMNMGFDQRVIEYDRPARQQGRSKWTLAKKLKLFVDGILSFSARPLHLLFVFAVLLGLTGVAVALGGCLGAERPGWLGFSGLVMMLSAVQIAATALVGEYVFRTFQEAGQHPLAIIREDTASDPTA